MGIFIFYSLFLILNTKLYHNRHCNIHHNKLFISQSSYMCLYMISEYAVIYETLYYNILSTSQISALK